MQCYLKRILRIFQVHIRDHDAVGPRLGFMPNILKVERRVSVGVRNLNGWFQQVTAPRWRIRGIVDACIVFAPLAIGRNSGILSRIAKPNPQVNNNGRLVFIDADDERRPLRFNRDMDVTRCCFTLQSHNEK